MKMIDQEEFLKLSNHEVAQFVYEVGPQVCVLPINGTRRWFMLERAEELKDGSIETYLDIGGKQYMHIYKMCFEHGLDTLLTPDFGSELLTRGEEYTQKIGAEGLVRMATHPDFLSFYHEYGVRVHFYGEYRKRLSGTPFAYLCDLFDQVTRETAQNNRYRLFHGVFANDATEMIAELSIQHFQKTGNIPSRKDLVEQYYGEYVDPATLFIGFDKFSVFDYPLLGLGEENLYFTVAPSLYLNPNQLRSILYDHIYLRKAEEVDYAKISKQDFAAMRHFYQNNLETVLGIGELHNGVWYPLLRANNNPIWTS